MDETEKRKEEAEKNEGIGWLQSLAFLLSENCNLRFFFCSFSVVVKTAKIMLVYPTVGTARAETWKQAVRSWQSPRPRKASAGKKHEVKHVNSHLGYRGWVSRALRPICSVVGGHTWLLLQLKRHGSSSLNWCNLLAWVLNVQLHRFEGTFKVLRCSQCIDIGFVLSTAFPGFMEYKCNEAQV